MLLHLLLLVLCSVQLSDTVQCLRCRRLWGTKKGDLIKNHLKTDVESCASTAEECEHDQCYSVEYTNATTGVKGEVRDCLGRYAFGYWKEKHVRAELGKKGADEDSLTNWYTCEADLCNNSQDRLVCSNATDVNPNGTYEIIDELGEGCPNGSNGTKVELPSGSGANYLLGVLLFVHCCAVLMMNVV